MNKILKYENDSIEWFFMLNSIIACTQEKHDRPSAMKAIPAVPFLTRQNDFVYVDKTNLKSVINQKFKSASVFTPTGYAVVENEKGEYAVIDGTGKVVLDFSPSQIGLNVVNGLTFYKKILNMIRKCLSGNGNGILWEAASAKNRLTIQ